MSKAALSGLDPLKDLLGDVLARLEALEAKVGIKGSTVTKQPSKSQVTGAQVLNGKSRADDFGTDGSDRCPLGTLLLFFVRGMTSSAMVVAVVVYMVPHSSHRFVIYTQYAKQGGGGICRVFV